MWPCEQTNNFGIYVAETTCIWADVVMKVHGTQGHVTNVFSDRIAVQTPHDYQPDEVEVETCQHIEHTDAHVVHDFSQDWNRSWK